MSDDQNKVPRWNLQPETDKWASRFPPGYAPVGVDAERDASVERWREYARNVEAATGNEIAHIEAPLQIDRTRAEPPIGILRPVNGSDWTARGLLGGKG